MPPNLNEEKKLWKKGYKVVACLDEVGRGCLAGPVMAAAVCTNLKFASPRLNFKFAQRIKDSKKLTPQKREEFYKILTKHPAIKWGLGRISEKVIDRINILEATKLAMEKAVKNLKLKINYLILDGNIKINSSVPQKSIVKGDEKVFSCAAASIIAKVMRDRLMEKYAKKFPEYGFDRHKGYGTSQHRKALKKHGPCKIHRKSFRPVNTCKLK